MWEIEPLYPYAYTLYGLHVHSNEPLPLLPAQRQPIPALTVDFASALIPPALASATLQYAFPYSNKQGESLMQIYRLAQPQASHYWIRFWIEGHWGDCLLREDGSLVQVVDHSDIPRQALIPFILGITFSLVMRLQGYTCLHASAIAIDGGVVAFVGPSGTGKSTTMTALLQQGAHFFSDDLVPLAKDSSSTLVYPGYPRVGLMADAQSALLGSERARVQSHHQGKWYHTPSMLDDGTHPWPLLALYVLSPRGADPALRQPAIVPLPQMQAVTELMPQTTGRTLRTTPSHVKDLARIATLARTIAVRRIERPNSLARLDALARAILLDVRQLPTSPAPPAPSEQGAKFESRI